MMRRPLGIVVTALFLCVCGVIGLTVGIGAPLKSVTAEVALMAFSFLSIAAAYGVWTYEPWGRRLAVGVAVTVVVAYGVSLFGGSKLGPDTAKHESGPHQPEVAAPIARQGSF
jgi:hypothetical protein